MERHARDVLRQAGVQTELNDDDLKDILSGSSPEGSARNSQFSSHRLEAAPLGSSSSSSPGSNDSSDCSLPSALLSELRSPQMFSPAPKSGEVPDGSRREYELRIDQLSEQLDRALQERRLVEMDFQRRLREEQASLQLIRQEAAGAIAKATAEQSSAELMLTQVRDKLEAQKSHFIDLRVSQALYQELRSLPSEDLSLRNFILLRVHDAVLPMQQSIEDLRRALDDAQRRIADADASKSRELRSTSTALGEAEVRERVLQGKVSELEAQVKRLQSRIEEEAKRSEELSSKGAAFDSLQSRLTDLRSAQVKDEAAMALQSAALERAQAAASAAEARGIAQADKIEVFVAERATLAAALEESRSSARIAKDEAECAHAMLVTLRREMERIREEAGQEGSGKGAASAALEERMEAELRRSREERDFALSEVRGATRELLDRELRDARAGRAEAQAEAQRMRQKHDGVVAGTERELAELRAGASTHTVLVADLRASVTTKSRECELLSSTLTEARAELDRVRTDCDMLRDAVSVARAEVARTCADAAIAKSGLLARITSLGDRLAVYETIEDGLDVAVVAAGERQARSDMEVDGVPPASEQSTAPAAEDELDPFSALLGGKQVVPTTAARRAAQAVDLARQLAEAHADCAAKQQRIDGLNRMLESATSGEATARALLDAVSGPQEYLLAMVREREAGIKTAKEELVAARRQVIEFDRARETAVADLCTLQDAYALTKRSLHALRAGIAAEGTGNGHISAPAVIVPPKQQHNSAAKARPTPSSSSSAMATPVGKSGSGNGHNETSNGAFGMVSAGHTSGRLNSTGEPEAPSVSPRALRLNRTQDSHARAGLSSSGKQSTLYVRRADPDSGHVVELPASGGLCFDNVSSHSHAELGVALGMKRQAHVQHVDSVMPGGEEEAEEEEADDEPRVVVRPLLRNAGTSPGLPKWFRHEERQEEAPRVPAGGSPVPRHQTVF